MRKSAKIRIFIAILMMGSWLSFVGGCAVVRELSPPSEASLTGDLSSFGGWFESGSGLVLDPQDSKQRQTLADVQREYDESTRNMVAVEAEATAFITLPNESFRLQIRFFSSEDSSHVEYRSRAGLYSGTLIQKDGELIHITESGDSEQLHQALPDELTEILTTTLFRLFQLPSESLRFDLSRGIQITANELQFLPSGYELAIEGYMTEKGDQDRLKVLYLPRKITLQHPAERIRISWVHQRLTGISQGNTR